MPNAKAALQGKDVDFGYTAEICCNIATNGRESLYNSRSETMNIRWYSFMA